MKRKNYKDARISRLVEECEAKTRLANGLLDENMRLRKLLLRGKNNEAKL